LFVELSIPVNLVEIGSASYGRLPTGASCPHESMAPVLAITGMVARVADVTTL
jgi:hypothetical protein